MPLGTEIGLGLVDMWFGATETWAAAGLLSQTRRRITSYGNGWLEMMISHV